MQEFACLRLTMAIFSTETRQNTIGKTLTHNMWVINFKCRLLKFSFREEKRSPQDAAGASIGGYESAGYSTCNKTMSPKTEACP